MYLCSRKEQVAVMWERMDITVYERDLKFFSQFLHLGGRCPCLLYKLKVNKRAKCVNSDELVMEKDNLIFSFNAFTLYYTSAIRFYFCVSFSFFYGAIRFNSMVYVVHFF